MELPGEFSHRGGIIDIFAPDWLRPVRIELFDDEIESLRSFEVGTQRSHETLDEIEVTVLRSAMHVGDDGRPSHRLPAAGSLDPARRSGARSARKARTICSGSRSRRIFIRWRRCWPSAAGSPWRRRPRSRRARPASHCHLPFESVERFSGDIGRVRDELDTIAHGDEVFIVSPTEAEVERLREILVDDEARRQPGGCIIRSDAARGVSAAAEYGSGEAQPSTAQREPRAYSARAL